MVETMTYNIGRREANFRKYIEYMENTAIYMNPNAPRTNTKINAQGSELAYIISLCYPENGTLFRFRPQNDYSISALENDELWFSAARTFNDPFDSLCHIDITKLSTTVFKVLGIPDHIKYIDKIDKCREYEKTFKDMGRNKKVVCLTEDIYSNLMWAHYADSGKGFALEYEVEKMTMALMKGDLKSPVPYPVIYSDERYDVTHDAINWFKSVMDKNGTHSVDGLLLVKPVIRKGISWGYEKEWRIIDAGNYFGDDISYASLPFVKPKAVYIGYHTPKEYELRIIDICKYKKINLHKITLDNDGNKSSLSSVPLNL